MKVKIGSTCSVKINTGNYETVDVSKTIEVEFEVGSSKDVPVKSAKVAETVTRMLKTEVEATLKSMGRQRYDSKTGKQIELW